MYVKFASSLGINVILGRGKLYVKQNEFNLFFFFLKSLNKFKRVKFKFSSNDMSSCAYVQILNLVEPKLSSSFKLLS